MSAVEVRQVRKRYGNHWVINEPLSLSVRKGEFMVLVGPSGCGKSTLLRMIAGLEDISEGELAIDGRVVNEVSPRQRGVAMVFQNYALYPHMTVRQNLSFALKLSKTPRAEIERRVTEAAEALGIAAHLDKRPAQLSGGQKQRVAMGRAMVRQPGVFLFDEPLSNLDAQLRVRMRAEIAHLHRRLGSTSIYVTHDQTEAMTLADRIAVLNAGRLEQLGTPSEVFHQPRSKFVAGFIGSPAMNFLPRASLTSAPAPAGTSEIGIRPEAVRLGSGGLPLGRGTVTLVERLGSVAYVHARLGDRTVVAETRESAAVTIDQEIPLSADPKGLFYFDGSGARVS